MDYEYFMGLALEQARLAFDSGEFPVGCVIVQDGQVISSGGRTGTAPERDFASEIDHAEIRAIKGLERARVKPDPEKMVIFSTMEPCLMCFGAILLAGIRTIVYAYEDVMGGASGINRSDMNPLYADARLNVVPHVGREKSLDLFYNFFNKETNLYWKNSFLEAYTLSQINPQGKNK